MDWMALLISVLLLGLMAGAAVALRRFVPFGAAHRGSGSLHVVAHRRLDVQSSLYIVEVEGHRLLLGAGSVGTRLLFDLTPGSPGTPGTPGRVVQAFSGPETGPAA